MIRADGDAMSIPPTPADLDPEARRMSRPRLRAGLARLECEIPAPVLDAALRTAKRRRIPIARLIVEALGAPVDTSYFSRSSRGCSLIAERLTRPEPYDTTFRS